MKHHLVLPFRHLSPGFTLVELITIMAILGVISVIAISKFGTIEYDVTQRVVADRFLEEIKYVRNYAITQHDTTWLVMDETNNQYGIYSGPTALTRVLIPDPHSTTAAVIDLDDEYNQVSFTSDFGGSDEVYFNWWGEPSSGGQIVINGDITLVLESGTGIIYED